MFLTRLREARVAVGLSQAEVAAKLRKPQSHVSRWECGERRVEVVELAGFAPARQEGVYESSPARARTALRVWDASRKRNA